MDGISQTERAGIFPLTKVKTQILDSPKGDYTDGKGWYFPSQKSQNPDLGFPEGLVFSTDLYMAIYANIVQYLAI